MTDQEDFDEEDPYDDEEDDRTLNERMCDVYGDREDWEADATNAEEVFGYTDAYRNFLENGCRGILTYEEAVEAYKWSTGIDPDFVTSWPEIDWVKRMRDDCAEGEERIRAGYGLSLEEFYALYWPYEPMIRFAY